MIQIKQYLKVAKLIAGNILNSGNEADSNMLERWLHESDENKAIYQKIKEDGWYHENKDAIEQFNAEKGWHNIQSRITPGPRTVKLIPKFYKYAAAILVVALASTYFFKDTISNNPVEKITPVIVNNNIKPGIDKATLTLETGETIALVKGASIQTQNATSNGEQITYQPATGNRQLTTNTLTIPRGGQFQITLADGTRVWLNSETQLKYPVAFNDGETRKVELIYGEAYFEVSPSTEHKGANFKVITPHPDNYRDRQEIEVLGTKFNIKAYKDETNIYTTLVEGKVSINPNVTPSLPAGQAGGAEGKILKPGEQSIVTVNTKNLQIVEVDVFREIAWKQGVFSFKNKPLKEIMAVLSRWYDMDVVFQNKALENVTFNGNLKKNQSIEEILLFIQGSINTYEINNKTIILK